MPGLCPERRKDKRSSALGKFQWFSLANRQCLLAGAMAIVLVARQWQAGFGGTISSTKLGRPSVHEKTHRAGTNRHDDAFSSVLTHLRSYRQTIKNTRYLTIIDYSKPSNVKRMYLMDMKTGRVEKVLVSHGKNSGC